MPEDMISKWVITRDRRTDIAKYWAKEVYVNKNDFLDKTKFNARCYFIDNPEVEYIFEKYGLYTKEKAFRKCREREITANFKIKNKLENDSWKCGCCGKVIYEESDCTIDHIRPKSSFKLKYEDMSIDNWKRCWDENNLQILCHKCNQRKRSLSIKRNREINKKSNKLQKRIRKQTGKVKNKIRFGIKGTDEDAYEIARRDSNQIDVKTFFRKDKINKK